MTIGAIGANPLLFLNSLSQNREASEQRFAPDTNAAANTAGPLSILPSRSALQLSFDNIIALQSLADETPAQSTEMSAAQEFLAEARKTPMERMREQVLQELGLTEESLAQLPPDERRIAEDRIRALIEEKVRQAMNADGAPAESNASMIEQTA
ncbi:MAG: hypothetical protein R3C27_06610 [Hyphomonadaceae bacterium]